MALSSRPTLAELADRSLTQAQLCGYMARLGLTMDAENWTVTPACVPGANTLPANFPATQSSTTSESFGAALGTAPHDEVNGEHVSLEPSVELLNLLCRRHVLSIPFENFDVALEGCVATYIPHIFDKLVTRQRGGYCFEMNSLIAAVLHTLGFKVGYLEGRVYMDDGVRARTPHTPPRNHLLLVVQLPTVSTESYIVDVGFGDYALQGALPLLDDAEGTLGTTAYQLRKQTVTSPLATLTLHELYAIDPGMDGWTRMYSFHRDHLLSATDVLVANHFVATHADSAFSTKVWAMFRRGDCAHILLGDALTTLRYRNGTAAREESRITSPAELRRVARDCFAVNLTASMAARVFHLNHTLPSHFAPRPQPTSTLLRPVTVRPGTLAVVLGGAVVVGLAVGYHLRSRGVALPVL